MPIIATPFAKLAPIIEDGTVQQGIKASLMQNTMFGIEFEEVSPWLNNMGQTLSIPRSAPLAPIDTPSDSKTDPDYQVQSYEESEASVDVYRDSIKIDMLENALTILGTTANQMNELGKQAGQSGNAIRRKSLYGAYLGGHAVALETEGGGSTTLRVNDVGGFYRQLNEDGKWLAVSQANPKPIQIGANTFALVVAVAALEPNPKTGFPSGRGTLTLAANATWTVNDPVVAMDAPYRIYEGGGTTNDAISTTDGLTWNSIRMALALHSENGVQPHSDGTYWVHMGPRVKNMLWSDPEFTNSLTGGVDTTAFGTYKLHRCMGCTFVENQQVPTRNNARKLQNSRISTTLAKNSQSIGAEIVNRNGVELGHTLVTGGGLGKIWYMPQKQLISAAGLDADEFYGMTVTADNMQMIVDDQFRFLMAAPTDDMRQFVVANWQWIGSAMCWNDYFGGTYSPTNDPLVTRNPYYKRAVAITHYAG